MNPASIAADDVVVRILRTGCVSGRSITISGCVYDPDTKTATFALPVSLADGRYRVALLAGSVKDTYGVAAPAANYSFDFFFLAGDANHDGRVDVRDLCVLAMNWQGSGKCFSQGDFNFDGSIDGADLAILLKNWQKTVDGVTLSSAPLPAILQ
jgi:hypothetical protein